MFKTFTLKNGIIVATYHMPELRSLNLRVSVKGGSLVESKEQEGLAHFMEHMLVQGIPSFPNAQLLAAYVESLAGNYNAYTSPLAVSFTITVPFSHTKDAVRIASEVFFEPLFPQEAIEKERRAVLNEINQHLDSRWHKFREFSRKERYQPTSILMQQTVGDKNVIKKIKHADLIDYWKKYFIPKNTYLFLCGNMANGDIRSLLEENFGKKQSTQQFSGFPKLTDADFSERKVAIRTDKELQVNYVDLVYPALSMHDETPLKMQQTLALTILGRLRTSRLFQLLRYQKGLVYGVYAGDSLHVNIGTAHVGSEVSLEHLDEVIQLMVQELVSFREKGPLEDELIFAKNYITNKWLMSFDHPTAISDWITQEMMWKDKIHMPEEYIKIINKLTVKDILTVMNNHWDMNKLQLHIQGPLEDTKENKKKYTEMIKGLK